MRATICPRCKHYVHLAHGPRCRNCYGCRTGRAPDREAAARAAAPPDEPPEAPHDTKGKA